MGDGKQLGEVGRKLGEHYHTEVHGRGSSKEEDIDCIVKKKKIRKLYIMYIILAKRGPL